jgi:lambda family phage portal protein
MNARKAAIGAIEIAARSPGWLLSSLGGLAGRLVGGFLSSISGGFSGGYWGAYHDAARRDSTTADWRARLSSADAAIVEDLDVMLARSRLEIANNGYAASIQGGYRRYVVGGGITARSAARHPETGEMLKTYNAQLDAIWEEWFWESALCDGEATKTMPEKQQLWMNELVGAGGVFVLRNYLPAADGVGLALQEIEYEQRDTVTSEYQGRAVRGGVETDVYGRPVAYHLYEAGHPLDDLGTKATRVEASRCCHVYRQDRVRQRIGAPWMRPVLARLRQLAMYEAYTMIQARTRAAYPGFIKQQAGSVPMTPAVVARQFSASQAAGAAAISDAGELRINIAPGVIPVLKPGQEPYFPTPSVPDSMFPAFVLDQLKGISAGCGLDIATVARWYADGNFSSQRQGKLDIWAEVDWIQDLLFVHKIMRRVRRQVIEIAIAEGRLAATGYRESDRWRRAYLMTNWQGPPKQSVDEIKDEAAWDMRFKSLRASPMEYCNERGKDPRDVLSEWREFVEMARDDYGLGDLLQRYFGTDVANRPREGQRPPGAPGGDDGGDGGGMSGLVARQAVLQSLLEEDPPIRSRQWP